MRQTIEIEKLQPERDEATIKQWIGLYLKQHLQWWSHKAKLHWSEEQITQHIEQQGLVQRDWEELTNAELKPISKVLTARHQDNLIGVVYAELGRDRYLKIPTGSISWIYTSESVRNQGIGQALLRPIHDWMHDQGVLLREVHVTQANSSAVHLYQSCGYRIVDHRMLG